MTKLEKIELEIRALGEAELNEFRRWFADFEADMWDDRLEADVESGRLDALGDEALAAHRGGRTRPL